VTSVVVLAPPTIVPVPSLQGILEFHDDLMGLLEFLVQVSDFLIAIVHRMLEFLMQVLELLIAIVHRMLELLFHLAPATVEFMPDVFGLFAQLICFSLDLRPGMFDSFLEFSLGMLALLLEFLVGAAKVIVLVPTRIVFLVKDDGSLRGFRRGIRGRIVGLALLVGTGG
jgi:hypothetical protein